MSKRDASHLPHSEITDAIIGGFFYVYNSMRFGFLESAYSLALERVLLRGGYRVATEVVVPIYFERELLCHHRLDMLVNDTVVVEVKATAKLHPVAERQLLHYLRATNLEVGLLLHFGPEAAFRRVFNSNRLNP